MSEGTDDGRAALVLLDERPAARPREMGPPLAAALGMVAYDVISAFNRSPLMPFDALPAGQAEQCAGILEGLGVRAAAVPTDRLPPSPQIFTVHNADVEADGLAVQTDLAGKMRKMPWDQILALSVARRSQSTGMTGMNSPPPAAGGVGMGLGGMGMPTVRRRPTQMKQQLDTGDVLAVMPAGAPVEIHFRADAFNYDYLAERLTTSSDKNFRLLASDLLAGASGARLSPAIRALVDAGTTPPAMAGDIFGRYNRWLKLLVVEGL